MKNRTFRLTALSLICSCGVGVVDPGGVAILYGLWDWVGRVPCMGPASRSCTFPLGRPVRPVSRKAGKYTILKVFGSEAMVND